MFARFKKHRKRRRSHRSRTKYASLEKRQLLTFIVLPKMTTDVAAFADTVQDAVVRIDQDRLIIRTTGAKNRILVRLEHGYLQVNTENFNALALQIDSSQYSKILLLSNGDDAVNVYGSNLQAQMRPDRLWVYSESVGDFFGEPSTMEIHGADFEFLNVSESSLGDYGPFVLTSNNRIRMYGDNGVDRLRMDSNSNFAIATSAEMTGEGYQFYSNVFGDLYVSGGGGDDFATLMGTRGFSEDTFLVRNSSNGNDVYFGQDNFSRISNDLWDGRFIDFETQRVDLLSGNDRSTVVDTLRPETWYRVDGNDLVGAFRRMVNVETIEIKGDNSVDALYRPESEGTLLEQQDGYVFMGDFNREDDDEEFSPVVNELIPTSFVMRFSAFEQILD